MQLSLFDDNSNQAKSDSTKPIYRHVFVKPGKRHSILRWQTCSSCGQELPHTTKYFNRRKGSRLRIDCYICQRLRRKARDANRSARHYGRNGIINKWVIAWLIGKQYLDNPDNGYRVTCYWSGQTIDIINDHWCIDHITPLSRGGDNLPDNLCICTSHMNTVKSDKTLPQWLSYLRSNGYEHELMADYLLPQKRLFDWT